MLIEEFDTGLKSKKNVVDINLSPKENHNNKLFFKPFLTKSLFV